MKTGKKTTSGTIKIGKKMTGKTRMMIRTGTMIRTGMMIREKTI